MKLKLLVAGLLAAASFGASATTIFASNPVGPSFTNALIGSITVSGASDITGNVFAAETVSFAPGLSFALDNVTFSSASVGSLHDLDSSATGFSFHNVAAGTYSVFASGTLSNNPLSPVHNLGFLGANYAVTAVPEPETFGMLLGGLALLGVVARRKAKKAA